MCLRSPYIWRTLWGVVRGLVPHTVLVLNWHVWLQDRREKQHIMISWIFVTPPPAQVQCDTTDPAGARPIIMLIAPIQLSVSATREQHPTLHLLFISQMHIAK